MEQLSATLTHSFFDKLQLLIAIVLQEVVVTSDEFAERRRRFNKKSPATRANTTTHNASSCINLTKTMTGFLSDVMSSLGIRASLCTTPGHQQLFHFTQTTSPSSYEGSDMLAGSRLVSAWKCPKSNQTIKNFSVDCFVYAIIARDRLFWVWPNASLIRNERNSARNPTRNMQMEEATYELQKCPAYDANWRLCVNY